MSLSGRLSARVDHDPQKPLAIGVEPTAKRDDSLRSASPAPRITATQSDQIIRSLSQTDGRVVEILVATRYASGRQIRQLLWDDSEAGRRLGRYHLKKLTDKRVVARLGRRVGGQRSGSDGWVYALDVVGQRLASRDGKQVRPPSTPGMSLIEHTLAVTQTYIDLRAAAAVGAIELIGFAREAEAWRTFRSAGRHRTLKPDAFAQWTDTAWEHAAFFEIDMATEHPGRITKKAETYISYWSTGIEQDTLGIFPRVVWLTAEQRRVEVLADAVDQAGGDDDLFEVTTPERFARSLSSTTEGGEP